MLNNFHYKSKMKRVQVSLNYLSLQKTSNLQIIFGDFLQFNLLTKQVLPTIENNAAIVLARSVSGIAYGLMAR